jgi:hypothetical protein
MPADGKRYRTIEMPTYATSLEKQKDAKVIRQINAAREAIETSPYRPDPGEGYKLLPPKDTTGGSKPIQLLVQVLRLQIPKGFILSYTVQEWQRVVYLEDLDLPFLYRIIEFQP